MIRLTSPYLSRFILCPWKHIYITIICINWFVSNVFSFQPLHKCLFPGSSVYNTFRSCTNPHCFELENVRYWSWFDNKASPLSNKNWNKTKMTYCVVVFRFLGTSGQNVDDLEKYSEAKDKIGFMERTLRWRHLAPTAPNTLGISRILSATCLFFYSNNMLGCLIAWLQ